ncbi:MAG: helix-hairpin-helix domain-containing protein [Candidatus Omnitrophica bacterium]|nr:helix-hairpin-helix domain-containing protein [Candidatus Omnitrophota bacterium]MDD5429692.1 helix-hairpin-helix domain-containing protein [Candidatus Omnitrophota bacterium]
MICKIKGKLVKKSDNRVVVDTGNFSYEVSVPKAVLSRLGETGETELVIYHYLSIDGNRALPAMVGFLEELEKDFFEKFISVSGVGPKAALRAFDKPVSVIARAIEDGDLQFLTTLAGIGKQKARQIVAHLQGKVGRFALIKDESKSPAVLNCQVVMQAKEILRRLQYSSKEIEDMVKNALKHKPQIDTTEDFLNEIYKQRG